MRVVLAPAAFKGTLSAHDAATAMALGVRDALPNAEIVEMPMADGGDGTLDVMLVHGYEPVVIAAVDALGKERVKAVMMPFDYTAKMSEEDAAAEAATNDTTEQFSEWMMAPFGSWAMPIPAG